MLKKTIKFKDLDGGEIVEDFYFNINKAELAEMELMQKGGLAKHLEMIIKADDRPTLITLFKELIMQSVGRRSPDGRRFVKNQEIRDDFFQTEAYSELFMELATQTDSAIAFINGIIPADLLAEMNKQTSGAAPDAGSAPAETDEAKYNRLLADPNWLPSQEDLVKMTPAQMQQAFARKAVSVKTDPTE